MVEAAKVQRIIQTLKILLLYFLVFIAVIIFYKIVEGYCWSTWVNLYRASEGVDLEIFTRIAALQHGVCIRPFAVDYARVDKKPVKEKLRCGFYGCICKDSYQKPGVKCADYKVRFLCKCSHKTVGENPTKDTFLCPRSAPKTLQCSGTSVIKVTSAYYGNIWFSPCGLGSLRSNCRQESSKTLDKMELKCNRKRTCTVNNLGNEMLGDGCQGRTGKLHIEYTCEVIARAPGNYAGKVGEIYVDPTCRYKCIFLLINRAICLPVCPLHYGFACPGGSVVRWTTGQDPFAKQCTCRKPVCLDIERSCKIGDQVYRRGERFPLGCQEECICLGRNELKCIPLCPEPIAWCAPSRRIHREVKHARYPQCICKTIICRRNYGGRPFIG